MIHSENISSGTHAYRIDLEGTIGEENSYTHAPHDVLPTQAFQPNRSVTIENLGDADVLNPRLLVDGRRRWGSMREIVDCVRRDYGVLRTDQEKAFAAWKFLCDNLSDSRAGGVPQRDTVLLLNSYGYAGCYDVARHLAQLLRGLGFEHVRTVMLGDYAHWLPEVFYDGAWHMFDAGYHTVCSRR